MSKITYVRNVVSLPLDIKVIINAKWLHDRDFHLENFFRCLRFVTYKKVEYISRILNKASSLFRKDQSKQNFLGHECYLGFAIQWTIQMQILFWLRLSWSLFRRFRIATYKVVKYNHFENFKSALLFRANRIENCYSHYELCCFRPSSEAELSSTFYRPKLSKLNSPNSAFVWTKIHWKLNDFQGKCKLLLDTL